MTGYNTKYNKELLEIITLIGEGNITETNGALEKFKLHISTVKNLGRFSTKTWNPSWREAVYNFGGQFISLNPIEFLIILKEEKEKSNKDECETLDFYYSEIDYNSLPNDTWVPRIKKLIEKYPYNPEFRHSYAHSLLNNNKCKEAIEQYGYALDKDKDNNHFLSSLFNSYIKHLNNLLAESKHNEGIILINKLLKDNTFRKEPHYHNSLIGFNQRLDDQIAFNKKLNEAEKSIKEIVKNETQKGQNRIIEILGFFSAIMAFIFSTISIGKNFKFEEAIIFNISLGLTLLIFVLVINLLFSNKKIKLSDFRIGLIVVIVLSLLLIVAKFGIPIWI
jgi:tetratricopeptide (TPR) repeat protein